MKTYPDPMTAEYCAGALSGGNATADEQIAAARHLSELIDEREALRAENEALQVFADRYRLMLYQVSKKHPNESRYETALRYLKQAEMHSDAAMLAAAPKETE